MNMDHMNFLKYVADADVAHLRKKEQTYRGSWKKRGGVGAFMMLARKWDRLEPMVREKYGYDVFEAIAKTGYGGEDGTVLAEIRDLRRYLLLVEAEMAVRCAPRPAGNLEVNEHGVLGPSPENGSQHATLTPWMVSTQWRVRRGADRGDGAEWFNVWWRPVGAGTWALEPCVQRTTIRDVPTVICDLYDQIDEYWMLRIEHCPPDAREHFPRLRDEVNYAELKLLPPWQQKLYHWDEAEDKYRVSNRAWTAEGLD